MCDVAVDVARPCHPKRRQTVENGAVLDKVVPARRVSRRDGRCIPMKSDVATSGELEK